MKNVNIEGFCTSTGKDEFIKAFCDIVHDNSKNEIEQFAFGDWPSFDWDKWTNNPLAVVGTLRGSEKVIWECQKRNHEFYYMDHAYFHATRDYKAGKYGQMYRVVKNQMQLNKIVELTDIDRTRIQKFKPIPFSNWQTGNHILVCPPTKAICRLYHTTEQKWLDETINTIKKYTDRPILTRIKQETIPLQEQLRNCHAMVTMQSTAAIHAIINGVPVFCDDISQTNPVGDNSLSNIEQPFYPDRQLIEDWIDSLLSCQFSMTEIGSGIAYETVKRLQ